jgi:hypothetical protein
MTCEYKIEGEDEESMDCVLDEACTYPECEAIPLNPVSFPLGPPTIDCTNLTTDVSLK